MTATFDPNVRAGEFPTAGTPQDKLRFLLRYAILAPSSHNTQPWRFQLCGDSVELHADRSRALPFADPQDRELIISCGAALAHLQVALRCFGYTGNVQLLPDPTQHDLLARIYLGDPHIPDATDKLLLQSLCTRHTNRKPFHEIRVPTEFLEKLEAVTAREGVWIKVVPEGERREALAHLIARADRDQLADPNFRWELSHWIHFDSTLNHDGIPGESLGMPGLIADVGPFLTRTFDTGVLVTARIRQLAINSPVLIVLGTMEDTPWFWLKTGQALSDLLLYATSEGVVSSYLNAPMEVAELRPQVCELLGASGYSQLILRLGYGDPIGPTPRRPLEEVMETRSTDTVGTRSADLEKGNS